MHTTNLHPRHLLTHTENREPGTEKQDQAQACCCFSPFLPNPDNPIKIS